MHQQLWIPRRVYCASPLNSQALDFHHCALNAMMQVISSNPYKQLVLEDAVHGNRTQHTDSLPRQDLPPTESLAPVRRYSEEFLYYEYKVTPCSRKYPHDWASCTAGHQGERAKRRDIRIHAYAPIACAYAKQKQNCPLGDSCPNAHNLFEYWLHPARYRTELCQYSVNCQRTVCFYAHNADELRPLDPSLPPAEVCWSAGAAFNQQQLLHQQQHLRHNLHDKLRQQQEVQVQQQVALQAVLAFKQQLQLQEAKGAEVMATPGTQVQQQVVYVPAGTSTLHSSSAFNTVLHRQQQQTWLANAVPSMDPPGLIPRPLVSATPSIVYMAAQQQQQQLPSAMQPVLAVPMSPAQNANMHARSVCAMQPDLAEHTLGLQQQQQQQQLSDSFSQLLITSDNSNNWSPTRGLTSSSGVTMIPSPSVCTVTSPSVTLLNPSSLVLSSQLLKPQTDHSQGQHYATGGSNVQASGSLAFNTGPRSQPTYTQGSVVPAASARYTQSLSGTVPWNFACPQGQQQQQQVVVAGNQQVLQPYLQVSAQLQ